MSAPEGDEAPVLVSACLLGVRCTYRGDDERDDDLLARLRGRAVIPICPEAAGGLPVPRPRCEIEGGDGAAVLDGRARVLDADGGDHTEAYRRGAQVALDEARRTGAALAVLKDRSPSCGGAGIYDGTHTRTLRPGGEGVTVVLLRRHGIEVVSEHEAGERLVARE
jgi:uncharacterized protein YbbK (DUF523 family)